MAASLARLKMFLHFCVFYRWGQKRRGKETRVEGRGGEGREYNNRQRKDGTEENTGRAMSRKKKPT